MSTIEFKLEAFEGPLDLLLFLVNRHKLDIYDIEISLLLDQYLEYMDGMEEDDFDQAGEFLAMAARLIYIKTCSLLPKAEEAEELKKELEGELIEYSMCKEAAARLRELCIFGDVFVRPPEKLPVNKVFTGTIDPKKLVDAYLGMSAKARSMKPVRAEQFDPIVTSRIVTVTSKIVHVLKMLYTLGHCTMAELYEGVEDKSARVATFLAVLELTKSGRVMLNDDNTEISFNRSAPRRKRVAEEIRRSAEAVEMTEEEQDCEDIRSDEPAETAATDEAANVSIEAHAEHIVPQSTSLPVSAVIPSTERERYIGAAKSVRELVIDLPMTAERSAANDIPAGVNNEAEPAEYRPSLTETETITTSEDEPCLTAHEAENVSEQTVTEEDINADNDVSAIFVSAIYTEKKNHGRINRFSCRYYWGYPAGGNCLPYRRERL